MWPAFKLWQTSEYSSLEFWKQVNFQLGFHKILINSFTFFPVDLGSQRDLPPIQIQQCHQLFSKSKSCQSLLPFYLLWQAAYSHRAYPQQIHVWSPPMRLCQRSILFGPFRYPHEEGLMFNSKFTYLKIFVVTWVFDLAEWYSSVMKSQYKHNRAIAI